MNLSSSFEDKLREAVQDKIEQKVREEIGPDLVRVAEENWKAYASRNGYDIDHVWEDVEHTVEQTPNGISIVVEWPELTALFEFGVDPHTIDGNPLLHFYWDEIGQWVTTDNVDWGSETGGIPESRAIRDALNQTRRDLS